VAHLARSGYTGPEKVYEGADGLLRSHTGAYFPEVHANALTHELGSVWRTEEVAVKPFPICHILHACVDSALILKHSHKLLPSDIVEVRALLHPETFNRVCTRPEIRRRPATEYIAKFSVYYTLAAALVRGKCGLAELEPDVLQDPTILALAERVNYEADVESQFPLYFSGGVVIRLKDGRTLTHVEKINRGAGDRALTGDEIATKFLENAELVMSRGRAEQIRDHILDMDRHSTREIARVLGASSGLSS
jgi:2-methylcitrate dehydratase PrpD